MRTERCWPRPKRSTWRQTRSASASSWPLRRSHPERPGERHWKEQVTSGSAITARAIAFVAAKTPEAERLGGRLAELTADPDAFSRALSGSFARLADPEYREGERRIAPGLGPTFGVRWPLNAVIDRAFRQATRGERPAGYLELSERLFAQ